MTGPAAGGGSGRRRSGRRGGESGTREAILRAAQARFGDLGYDRATIRGIASDAGVDAALVHHFFGTKERLFAAAMRLPVVPGEVIAGVLADGTGQPGAGAGERLMRGMLGVWDEAGARATFLGLLRSAVTSEQAATMLREFVAEEILGRIAGAAAGGDTGSEAGFRAALVASQVLGLALTRYVLRLGPLAEADHDVLAAAIGPTLERYLTAELRPGSPSSATPPTSRSTPLRT